MQSRRAFLTAARRAGLGIAVLPMAARTGDAADPLVYFTWTGYEVPELHKSYSAKYGREPGADFFSDEEQALQKVRSGFKPDVAHPCVNTLGRWRDAGVIKPIDTAKVAAWDSVLPEIRGVEGVVADGQVWMVPFEWGTSSIIYRSDLVDIKEESWTLFLDERYKGKMAFLDAIDNVAAMGGMLSGAQDPFAMTDADLAKAKDALKRMHQNMRFYWTDQTELEQGLAAGEVVAAWGWMASVNNLKSQGVPVKFMTPKEGILTWVCGMVRIAEGPAPDEEAYDFIDAMLDPQSGKYVIEVFGYGHSNAESFEVADPAKVKALGFDSPQAFLAAGRFFREIKPDVRQKISDMWEQIKAGA
jgi:spermidine/putrescine-binding protein